MRTLILLMVCCWVAACSVAADEFTQGEAGHVITVNSPLSLTLELTDAQLEVRLAEIEIPTELYGFRMTDIDLIGQSVRLEYGGLQRDRYDRALAQVYRTGEEGEHWLQGELISMGAARVYSYADNHAATPALLTLEQAARDDRRGLWALPEYRIRDTHPDGLAQDIGSVQLVEGRVLDVTRLASGRTYINFGLDYRTDFTVIIEARDQNVFEDAGLDILALETRRIRVRGWLDEENGPMMRLDHPQRLEVLED